MTFLSFQLRSTKIIGWLYPGGEICVTGCHVTSRNQGLSSKDQGRQRRETLGTRLYKEELCRLATLVCYCILWRHFKQSHRLMMWCFFFRARRFCPTGSYLNNLDLFDKLQCCRPLHHPKSYGSCYYEDVLFNSRRRCQLAGYYITGFYRYSHYLPLSVSKLRCCKMAKTGNSILFDSHMDQESVVR